MAKLSLLLIDIEGLGYDSQVQVNIERKGGAKSAPEWKWIQSPIKLRGKLRK